MSTALDQIADISFTRDTPVVQVDSYGILLIASAFLPAKTTVAFNRFRDYYDLPSMKTDGWAVTDEVYILAKNAFNQDKQPAFIRVGRRDAADADWGVALDAITAADSGFYLVSIADAIVDADVPVLVSWINSNKKFIIHEDQDADVIGSPYNATAINSVGGRMKSLSFFRGRVFYSTAAQRAAGERHGVAAMIAEAWRVPGSFTYKFRSPAGISSSNLTLAQKKNAWSHGVETFNIVTAADTRGIMENGQTPGGEWVDIIIFDDWLQSNLQVDLYSYLRQQPKAPLSDDGLAGIQAKIQARMETGADNGGLIKSTIKITIPKYSAISAADRQARRVTGIKVTANHLQAIHFLGVTGVLSA